MKAWVRSFFVVSALLLTTQVWAIDLSGVWRSDGWGEIKVTQQGQNVTAIYTGNFWGSLNLASVYGFKAGDESFHGTLTGSQLATKMSLHYPLSMKNVCPSSIWAAYGDVSYTVSSDGKTLTGQFSNEIRSYSNCSVINTTKTTLIFTKTSSVVSSACPSTTIDSNLNVHIPYAIYNGVSGNAMSLWIDLQYAPSNGSDAWKLYNFGVNSANSTCSSATINTSLNVHIPSAIYKGAAGNSINLWIDLQYAPMNGGDAWKLYNFGVNP
jgi:hypothetical protein